MTEFTSEFIENWKNAIKVVAGIRGEMREVEKFALEALDHIECLQQRVAVQEDLLRLAEGDKQTISEVLTNTIARRDKRIAELEQEREKVRILVDAIHNDYDDIPCVEGCHMEFCDCARGDIAERLLELSKIVDKPQPPKERE